MARYDEDTIIFMEKIAGEQALKANPAKITPPLPEQEKNTIGESAAKSFKTVALSKSLPEAALRIGTGLGLKDIFKEAGLGVIQLYQYLNDKYGREWWDWEPETCWRTFTEDGLAVEDDLKGFIGAFQCILNTNLAHEQWHVFEKVGHAFNRNPVEFCVVQPLELNEIALTFKVLNTIRPKQDYEPEICAYVAASAKNSGVVYLPPDLFMSRCQDFLNDMNNNLDLAAEVKNVWPQTMGGGNALGIQVKRLHEIKEYANNG